MVGIRGQYLHLLRCLYLFSGLSTRRLAQVFFRMKPDSQMRRARLETEPDFFIQLQASDDVHICRGANQNYLPCSCKRSGNLCVGRVSTTVTRYKIMRKLATSWSIGLSCSEVGAGSYGTPISRLSCERCSTANGGSRKHGIR